MAELLIGAIVVDIILGLKVLKTLKDEDSYYERKTYDNEGSCGHS